MKSVMFTFLDEITRLIILRFTKDLAVTDYALLGFPVLSLVILVDSFSLENEAYRSYHSAHSIKGCSSIPLLVLDNRTGINRAPTVLEN